MKSKRTSPVVSFPSLPPMRGQVWWADFGESVGHEQGFHRPFLVLSNDRMNEGPCGLVIGVPITSRTHEQFADVRNVPPEAGLTEISHAQPQSIRSISTDRLRRPGGHVSKATMAQVEDTLRILVDV